MKRTEERISELKDRAVEITQHDQKRDKDKNMNRNAEICLLKKIFNIISLDSRKKRREWG